MSVLFLINRKLASENILRKCHFGTCFFAKKMGQIESIPRPDEAFVMEEGAAKIYFPKDKSTGDCFYNSVQEFNRDLTCTIIAAYQKLANKKLTIFEAFSQSGLRSIRYALECSEIEKIIANNSDQTAFDIISRNIQINGVSNIVEPSKGNPRSIMAESNKAFDVLDLDPTSSSSQNIESAIKSAKNGALLCITSTDGRTLCGMQPNVGFAAFNCLPINSPFAHEFGIRMLLTLLISTAARHRRSIEPLLSLSLNYYFRIFVRIHDKPSLSQKISENTSLVLYSPSTECFWLQPLGEVINKGKSFVVKPAEVSLPFTNDPFTGLPLQIAGPVYTGPIHNKDFIQNVLDMIPRMAYIHMAQRMNGVLNTCLSEIDFPFYYDISSLSSIIKIQCPLRSLIVSEIERNGYKTSLSHCRQGVLKTDAPYDLIWDIFKKLYIQSLKSLPENDPENVSYKIMTSPFNSKYNILLEVDDEIEKRLRKEKQNCKYYENPASSFGQQPAAKRTISSPLLSKPKRSPSFIQDLSMNK